MNKNLVFLLASISIMSWTYTRIQAQCKVNLSISSDAQIHDVNSGNNYGHSQELMAKRSTNGSVTPIQRALFNFDWSCIPDGVTIDSARLFLYNKLTSVGNTHHGDNVSWLQRIDETWGEMTVTWDNQPATTTNNQLELPSKSGNEHLSILVTTLVQDIMDEPSEERYGFLMKLQSETDIRRQNYASSDYENEELHPMMTVYYSYPKVHVTALTTAGSNEIEPGDTATVLYEICNSSCCVLENESMTLNLPIGFTVSTTTINPSSTASFVDSTLFINNLSAEECFEFYVGVKANYKTSLGAYDFCLSPNDSLDATGDLCASTKLVESLSVSEEVISAPLFQVYPNPSNGQLTVEFDNERSKKQIRVIDPLGRAQYISGNIQSNKVELDLSRLTKGLYTILVTSEQEVTTRPLILE